MGDGFGDVDLLHVCNNRDMPVWEEVPLHSSEWSDHNGGGQAI